jgi:hypothetical protein
MKKAGRVLLIILIVIGILMVIPGITAWCYYLNDQSPLSGFYKGLGADALIAVLCFCLAADKP